MFRLYRAREKDRKANEAAGLGKASDWDMLQFTTEGQNLIIRKPPSLADIEVKDL